MCNLFQKYKTSEEENEIKQRKQKSQSFSLVLGHTPLNTLPCTIVVSCRYATAISVKVFVKNIWFDTTSNQKYLDQHIIKFKRKLI
jgi:hypothetical protein